MWKQTKNRQKRLQLFLLLFITFRLTYWLTETIQLLEQKETKFTLTHNVLSIGTLDCLHSLFL